MLFFNLNVVAGVVFGRKSVVIGAHAVQFFGNVQGGRPLASAFKKQMLNKMGDAV